MALVTTTLSAACGLTDSFITVASSTSVAAGRIIKIDDEVMKVSKGYVSGSTTVTVLRAVDGTSPDTHANSSNVNHGDAADFVANTPQQDTLYPKVQTRAFDSYSVAGALSSGAAWVTFAQIIGTSALAMTLALPTKDQDGQILHVIGNGKSASTVTLAGGGTGNAGAGYTAYTFQNAGQVTLSFIALNGFWLSLNTPLTGTTTKISVAIA